MDSNFAATGHFDMKKKNSDLTDTEELFLFKLEKLQASIDEQSEDYTDDWIEDDIHCSSILPGNPIVNEKDDLEFVSKTLRSVTWEAGIVDDPSAWRSKCRAMTLTYFKFTLFEDGQWKCYVKARNSSNHARWLSKVRMQLHKETNAPDDTLPGSYQKLLWIGGKKNSNHEANKTGRYKYGKENFDLIAAGDIGLTVLHKCKRTH